MQRSRRGERKQAGSVQHKFWSIKSVKRELCKKGKCMRAQARAQRLNGNIRRWSFGCDLQLSNGYRWQFIKRYLIDIFVASTITEVGFFRFPGIPRICVVSTESDSPWGVPSDCCCSYCAYYYKFLWEHLWRFQHVLASVHLHACLFSTSRKMEQRSDN